MLIIDIPLRSIWLTTILDTLDRGTGLCAEIRGLVSQLEQTIRVANSTPPVSSQTAFSAYNPFFSSLPSNTDEINQVMNSLVPGS